MSVLKIQQTLKEAHLRKADAARAAKNKATQLAKTLKNHAAIAFDLQKNTTNTYADM